MDFDDWIKTAEVKGQDKEQAMREAWDAATAIEREAWMSKSVWTKEPPTEPGYYWYRYIDIDGVPKDPDILWLVGSGRSFEFGSEMTWEPKVGCFEYGPKIDSPKAG